MSSGEIITAEITDWLATYHPGQGVVPDPGDPRRDRPGPASGPSRR